MKPFSVGDEFLLDAIKAHLIASVCFLMGIISCGDYITHDCSLGCLETTAESLVAHTLYPVNISVPVLFMHSINPFSTWLSYTLTYVMQFTGKMVQKLLGTVRCGYHAQFLGEGFSNYGDVAANFIANLSPDFSKHHSYIHAATNNHTVNMQAKPGYGKPIDQLIEHYFL